MKKHNHRFRIRKIYAVALLLVTVCGLAMLDIKEFLSLLVPLYVVSLVPSYAIQAEHDNQIIDIKAIFGFAVAFALAGLMAYAGLNLMINGL